MSFADMTPGQRRLAIANAKLAREAAALARDAGLKPGATADHSQSAAAPIPPSRKRPT